MSNDVDLIKTGGIILGGVAIAIIIIMTILLGFDSTIRSESSAEVNVTLGNTNASTDVGTSGTYPYLQTAVCINETISTRFNSSMYTIETGDQNGGTIVLADAEAQGDLFVGEVVDCSITYLADTEASRANRDFINGLLIFGSFAGVVAIGIMGFALFNMFGAGGRKKRL